MKDEDFVAMVRRSRPSSLIPLIADLAASRFLSESWSQPGQVGYGTPWALAEIARVSLAHGNEHRAAASKRDLARLNDAYNNLDDPQLSDKNDGVAGFFLRNAEQLEYQLPLQPEMSRAVALLQNTTPIRPTKVIVPGWDQELFGCDLTTFISAGHLLHVAAISNSGRYSPAWLDSPAFAFLDDYLNLEHLKQACLNNYVIDAPGFRALNGLPRPSEWRRYSYNPLLGRPVISGYADNWLIPVPGLVVRRISPLGIYYAGMERFGKAFADDLGYLFEPYVGNHLDLLPEATVHRASDGDDKKGNEPVDFIVSLPEAVVLIEVKSIRPTAAVRAGADAWQAEVQRMIGKGVKQLERDHASIETGSEAFAHIPTDRPRIGLIVTLEDFHVLNSGFHAPVLDRNRPDLPISVVSAGDIERWVTINDVTPGDLIVQAAASQADHGDAAFSLKHAFDDHSFGPNPLLEAAWETGFWKAVTALASERD